jgi:hypothetical protein
MDFSGNTAETVDRIATGSATLAGGAVHQVYSTGVIPFDVRAYSSIYVEVEASVVGTPTQFNQITVNLWGIGDLFSGTTVWQDFVGFWPFGGSPALEVGGSIFYSDSLRAPYVMWDIGNAGVDTCNVSWNMYGTTRALTTKECRSSSAPSRVPMNLTGVSITSGTFQYFPIEPCAGFQKMFCQNNGPGTATILIRIGGPTGQQILNVGMATGTVQTVELILPQTANLFGVVASGGNVSYTGCITSEH